MNDVIQLESPEELVHCDGLECIASQALDGDKEAQVFLTELWEEPWTSIKTKLETEGCPRESADRREMGK